jgi:transcriptional regulator with GAF, ATPase, and Fis domain
MFMEDMPQVHSISLIAKSAAVRDIVSQIDTIASSDSSVLLIGETGVGKELFAEYVHRTSSRSPRPFVKVSLAALPPELLESELFGHDKGAYTSASSEKKGLFELADSGSIFLDDIDDFPLPLQSKLLRVLESHELMRVGGTTPIPVDVRLITATKVDLKEMVQRNLFRADLYYRINVVPFVIPPLRERAEDIPILVDHFIKRFSGDRTVEIDREAMTALTQYSWPGNIRELRNTIQRILLFVNGAIHYSDLPPEVRNENPVDILVKACNRCFAEENMTFEQVVECLEINLLRRMLEESRGNRTRTAKKLGMNLSTLRDKLRKYNLDGEIPPQRP